MGIPAETLPQGLLSSKLTKQKADRMPATKQKNVNIKQGHNSMYQVFMSIIA